MNSYPYHSIVCTGRQVAIDAILNETAQAATAFERALFNFIRQWLLGVSTFELFTSGSTGTPKRIVVTRQQMIASAKLTAQALELRPGLTALICLNPEYIAGKMMIVRSLETGFSIVAVEPAANPMKSVNQPIDFTAMVPLQVHELLHTSSHHFFKPLSTVIIGGGAIDAHDVRLLQQIPCSFYATYGMTETVSHVALRALNGKRASDYYEALPGIHFSRDDRDCLIIHWRELGRPMVTNDLVQLVDETRFIWLGRWDNVINSGGIKIIPETLEATLAGLLKHAGHHARFFISSLPDARLGRKLVLVIEGDPMPQNHNELRSTLKASLQSYDVPKEIIFCRRFIETQSGKIDRIATLESAITNHHSPD